MREVVASFRHDTIDPVHQICSLIANSYLNVDLGNPLGPDSILTIGPAFSFHTTTLPHQSAVVGHTLGSA